MENDKLNEYIIVSNDGFTIAPDGNDVENQQVLDYIFAKNKQDAIHQFRHKDPVWNHVEAYLIDREG